MNVQQHDFFLLVALLIAAATPASGQIVTPAVAPASSATQSAATTPDFSGIWVKPYLGIESPLSGPGPVVNKFRRRQIFDIDGRRLPVANAPLVSIVLQVIGDYSNPILKPIAADVVRRRGEMELSGTPFPSARNQCWPEGVPAILADIGIQMFQQPDRITILYAYDHQVRRVRMNEPHPAQVTPSWYGDSVGHYEGDTLVIDTVGVKTGPLAMVDWFGTPFTHALHVVERYRLIDYEAAREGQIRGLKEHFRLPGDGGDSGLTFDPDYRGEGLQLHFTVEDEGVFTMSWSAIVTYRRSLPTWPEWVCAENLRATYAAKDSAAPRADKPDF
jgi:hypothetical protein